MNIRLIETFLKSSYLINNRLFLYLSSVINTR
nr:MAG TPA: hypothetical protein [Caudoviricetes sp.]